ncbi:MAG: ATP-binding protein [Streptomyces sp.]|uniref:ATP-binding protein n=1 Tax=Streptomyces sp. TaxID=1931 RepID=UPI003D6B47F3
MGAARRRMRADLVASGAGDTAVDDAVLILSELLSNACRHARPLGYDDSVRASWKRDLAGELTIAVTDGGGPTRPLPATPSISARGGRGLAIIGALAQDWGVREESYELTDGRRQSEIDARADARGVTVWVVLAPDGGIGEGLADSLALDLATADELR